MPPVSRRSVLIAPLGAVAVLLVGCRSSTEEPAPVDPDRVSLTAALEREESLLQLTAGWRGTTDLLTPAAAMAMVTAHIDALKQTLGGGPTPTASVTPTQDNPPASSDRQLAAAASDTALAHRRALMTTGGPTARLLASLSASDAALARAVRAPA
jgi:hypothetical protein